MYDENTEKPCAMPQKRPKTRQKRQNSSEKVTKKTDTNVEILGTTIFGTRKSEVLRKLWLQRKEMLHVATVNPEFVMEARRNERFRASLAHCLTVADGWGVVWANVILKSQKTNSQIGSKEKLERVSGVELVEAILAHADQTGESVFLLGGKPGVAEQAAQAMRIRYPGARLEYFAGAETVRLEKHEEANMTIAKINAVSPDYLLVAYGSPWQDIWIEDNRPYLRVRIAIGVGGVLDEWAGRVARCPAWIDRIGLKWLFRLTHEPWRWRRVARVFGFGFLVLWQRLKASI
jgi:N-acetylglucosaminyldiphosphoundecaprenol N-acetyl-beta-D-mannosaminyltransferase